MPPAVPTWGWWGGAGRLGLACQPSDVDVLAPVPTCSSAFLLARSPRATITEPSQVGWLFFWLENQFRLAAGPLWRGVRWVGSWVGGPECCWPFVLQACLGPSSA